MLKKIFPPLNELTVFVIATTLFSMLVYMDGWFTNLVKTLLEFFTDVLSDAKESGSVWENIKAILACYIVMPFLIVASVLGPLFLPFTKKDLRGVCFLVLLTDAAIILIGNFLQFGRAPSALNAIIAVYCAAWIVYLVGSVKYKKYDRIMSTNQMNPHICLQAAGVSIMVLFVAINLLSISWVLAYSLVVIITSMIYSKLHDILSSRLTSRFD